MFVDNLTKLRQRNNAAACSFLCVYRHVSSVCQASYHSRYPVLTVCICTLTLETTRLIPPPLTVGTLELQ